MMQTYVYLIFFLTVCFTWKTIYSQCPDQCSCPRGRKLSIYCLPGKTAIPNNIPSNTFALSISGTYSQQNHLGRLTRSMVSKFVDLQRLHLAFSQIREIENGTFSNLRDLRQLNLANNHIEKINARTFDGLEKLEVLHLTGNQYCKIDENAFTNLKSLKELHMGQIGIMSVSKNTFDGINLITILDLHGNNLQDFDRGIFKKLPHLEYLDLSGNLFRKLSNESEVNFRQLKTVHLFDNPWQCNCEIKWMKRLQNAFQSGTPVVCVGPDQLQYMSISDLKSSDFHCIKPKIVSCSTNKLDVDLNSNVKVDCRLEGDPMPDVTWVKPTGTIIPQQNGHGQNRIYNVFKNGTLQVGQIAAEDDGLWEIKVSSTQGHDGKQVNVHVKIPTTTVTTTTTTTKKPTTTTIRQSTRMRPVKTTTPLPKSTTTSIAGILSTDSISTIENGDLRSFNTVADQSSIKLGLIIVGVGGGVSLVAIISLSAYIFKKKLAIKNKVGERRKLSEDFDSVRTPRSERGLSPVSYAWA